MATNVILPMLGQTMEEGTITKWLKHEGENVQKGEPLLEVMTDKANMEVESPASGVLLKILAPENATVPVKEIIAIIGEPGEAVTTEEKPEPAPKVEEAKPKTESPDAGAVQPKASAQRSEDSSGRIFASPRAKMTAAELGIDISLLAGKGSGPGGRIIERDVLDYAEKKTERHTGEEPFIPKTPVESRLLGRKIPITPMRKSVADSVSASIRNAPHVTLTTETDVTELIALRKHIAEEIEKIHGVKPSFTAFVVKAAALAILDHPIINSSLTEEGIIIHDEINIGVAVAVEGGLVVPVIRQADIKPIYKIAQDMERLIEKAREGKLIPDDMHGGTFSITSLSSYGVDMFNPIINPPQSAILGVCRSVEKPAVVNGEITIRSMMNLCLSFDHRVLDGAPAAQYLSKVKELLEKPYLLILER